MVSSEEEGVLDSGDVGEGLVVVVLDELEDGDLDSGLLLQLGLRPDDLEGVECFGEVVVDLVHLKFKI